MPDFACNGRGNKQLHLRFLAGETMKSSENRRIILKHPALH